MAIPHADLANDTLSGATGASESKVVSDVKRALIEAVDKALGGMTDARIRGRDLIVNEKGRERLGLEPRLVKIING
jgi:hypothetical protein